MPSSRRHLARLLPLALALPGLAGCAASGAAQPTPSVLPSSTPEAAFAMDVFPTEDPVAVRALIPGEHSSFLVRIRDAAAGGSIVITATSTGATLAKIVQPSPAKPVGEVWFTPTPTSTDAVGSITISATRGAVVRTEQRSFQVMPMEGDRERDARPYFERWVAWLAARHPELGITAGTTWQPEYVSTLLVVSHYAYYSEDWELTLAWHNMIPPNDWTEIHLRRRGTDVAPSVAYRQDSVKASSEPRSVVPPEAVVR